MADFNPNAEFCPSCGARWWTDPIPDEHWTDGPKEGYPTHYSLVFGIYDQGQDRTVAWMCPFCRREWPRG